MKKETSVINGLNYEDRENDRKAAAAVAYQMHYVYYVRAIGNV
jgi:hypothetical protein